MLGLYSSQFRCRHPVGSQEPRAGVRDIVLVAAAGNKSSHPNRQGKRPFEELQGSTTSWITVSLPGSTQPSTQAGQGRRSRQQHQGKQHQHNQQSQQKQEQRQRPRQDNGQDYQYTQQDHAQQSRQQQQDSQQRQAQRSAGRYLKDGLSPSQPTQSPNEVLHYASQLSAAAGSDVTIHGPRLRRWLKPVRAWQYMGMYGQSHSQWFLWRRWLAGRKRASRQRHKQAHSSFVTAAADRQGQDAETGPFNSSGGSVSQQGWHLCMLDMDDWDLDLEELEEGIQEHMLYRSKRDMEAHLAMSAWRQLMTLHNNTRTEHLADSNRQPLQAEHQQAERTIKKKTRQPGRQQAKSTFRQSDKGTNSSIKGAGAAHLPIRLYKGGGYVAADLEAMLQNTGLSRVLQLQMQLEGANCILAMPKWKSGRAVDLRQQQAAALKRQIPLIQTRSLRPRDVLLALRPLFMDLGLLQEEQAAAQRQVICLKRSDHTAHEPVEAQKEVTADTDQMVASRQPYDDNQWHHKQRLLLQQLAQGSLNVCGYIKGTQL